LNPKKVINNSKSVSSSNNNNNNNNNTDDNPNQQQQQPSASGRRTPPLHSYLRQADPGNKNYNKPSSSPSPSTTTLSSLLSAVTIPPAETSPLIPHTTLSLSSSSSVNRYGGVGGDNNNE
jgi:hypothetical protein